MCQCKVCKKQITEMSKAGRPKNYCSVNCRRVAEYQMKRVKNRVLRLEKSLPNIQAVASIMA